MTSDIELHPDFAPAPTTLFASDDPAVVVQRATRIANAIAPLIRERNLYKRIGKSEHVYVEAWALAGSMLGVFAITVRTWEIGDDQGYGAAVEARTLNGSVVGRAEAVVMRSEAVGTDEHGQPIRKWLEAPAFQLISMAQTRGSSKALRMPLGFVMKLAGYEMTPAEEMEAAAARGESVSGGRGVADGWRNVHEQNRAHERMDAYVAEHGLSEWVAVFLDSKGYTRPLAKGQMADLRRAMEAELAELADQTSETAEPAPQSPPRPTGSAPTSEGAAVPATPTSHTRGAPSDDQSPEPNPQPMAAAGSGEPRPPSETSPSEGGPPGRGRSRRGGSGNAPAASESPPAEPSDEAEQAAFNETLAGGDTGRWTR